jgi:lysosomal alpha-mannosidase
MHFWIVPSVLLLNFHGIISNPIKGDIPAKDSVVCQKTCHPLVDGKINVHLVPHSHDDLGWLKTFDQYYEGTGQFNAVENAGVRFILSSTIPALKADPNRRYIQVETGFFWKWWQEQSNETRQDVVDLVNSGQLEMINGGWSMNDEAASHYHSIIDQFTWGFRILEDTVGKCGRPKIGWQIDPFGHSKEHASILKQLGFEGLVVVRIDYRDKNKRRAEKNLDFIWKSNDNLENSEIFTTMFPDFYFEESGYCFDVMCSWNTINEGNLDLKVKGFAEILDGYKEYYKTNNIMMPMGRDFTYQKAEQNFASMDLFLTGFKDHDKYNVIYSTPSCYIQAVQDEIQKNSIKLEEKTDDFFPYASEAHSFWTGYFTSRPTSKRFERTGNNILQSVKQLTAFAKMKSKDYGESIADLRGAMGVMQHHDGITGTEKQAVSNDYAQMLHQAIKEAEEPVGTIIGELLRKNDEDEIDLQLSSCLLANVSICDTTGKDRFLVVVQNPLSRVVTHYVHLPVEGDNYKVTGPDGEEVYDVFDTLHSFDYINEPTKPSSKDLVFAARNLPALGINLYYVEKMSESSNLYKPSQPLEAAEDGAFGTETNGFKIDTSTGKLASVTINGATQEISQEFLYYPGYTDSTTTDDHRSSGAYIFRPAENEAKPMTTESSIDTNCAKGNLVDQCIQIINDEVRQIIKVYKDADDAFVEFDWLVGDLQFVDNKGKEVITRFTVKDFSNSGTFYTDANGRQQVRRELNKRGDFEYDPEEEPVSSNYYPVTSKIVIKDETKKLEVAVLNDRAQGGTSLKEGTVELMIHRRLLGDDDKGVKEALNEIQYDKGLYVRGQHYLTFGSTESKVANGKSTAAFERDLAHRKLLAPWILLSEATDTLATLEKTQQILEFKFEALKKSLPDNVHILTLEPWKNSYLLRLEHALEKNEDDALSTEVTVDLEELFTLFNITEIWETTLGANQVLDESPNLKITLKPMEIRTFIIKTDQNNDDIDNDNDNSAGSHTLPV